jgi:hypothetical protein
MTPEQAPKTRAGPAWLLAIFICGTPVFAHHGTAASYDQKKTVHIKGVVKEFLWRNPHSSLYIESKDDSGKAASYAIEMGSPGQLAKQGYRRNTFQSGDQIEIEMHPSFTNPSQGENLAGNGAIINGKVFKPDRSAGN